MKHTITIDFETYYTVAYSLTKMTTIEYVLHPDFEVIGFSYSVDGSKPKWVSGDFATLAMILRTLPWDDAVCVAHNAIFDGAILEWIFQIHPAKYLCTMMGSRPYVAPFVNSMSLGAVSDFLHLGQKGQEVKKAINLRRLDFGPQQLKEYGDYCSNDVELCDRLARYLLNRLPSDEQDTLDLTIKKFTRPQLMLDSQVLKDKLEQVQVDKAKALLCLPPGVSKDDLMSNDKLAMVLQRRNVTPPRKLSPATMKSTWAFAKTDDGFAQLLTHSDPDVRAIAEARVLWKSTLEESRLQRFISISTFTDYLPVALLYYGAHTGRLSGLDSINLQNLPRPKKGELGLRHALVAPPGYKVVTVDLSQIEARIVATLAGQWDLITAFANGDDIYSTFASLAYGYPCDKINNPTERFVGKTCILGLGYGMGPAKLFATLVQAAAKYKIVLTCTEDDCDKWVKLYRTKYASIAKLWRQMDRLLKYMCEPKVVNQWKMLTLTHNKCRLPNGMELHYPKIFLDGNNAINFYGFKGQSKLPIMQKIWGGGFLENVCQALAQLIIKRAELRLAKHGLYAALQVHDELVYVVADDKVDRVKKVLELVLKDPVPWLPELPLACEVGVGQSYGDAK